VSQRFNNRLLIRPGEGRLLMHLAGHNLLLSSPELGVCVLRTLSILRALSTQLAQVRTAQAVMATTD